jgi:non-specific serine/threonine protein kinase
MDDDDQSNPRQPGRPAGFSYLTPREFEVAALIGSGLTSKEIAARLTISKRTADAHAEHIRRKLGLHSRAQIAAWAVEQGLRQSGL